MHRNLLLVPSRPPEGRYVPMPRPVRLVGSPTVPGATKFRLHGVVADVAGCVVTKLVERHFPTLP